MTYSGCWKWAFSAKNTLSGKFISIYGKLKVFLEAGPITSWQIGGETMETVTDFILFSWVSKSLQMYEIKIQLLLGRKAMTTLDSMLYSRDIMLPTKVHIKSYGFSSSHVWMWDGPLRRQKAEHLLPLNCGVGEDIWELLDCKKITPVNPKGNQLWIFIGRSVAEDEAPIFWPLDAKAWLIGKDPDGKD